MADEAKFKMVILHDCSYSLEGGCTLLYFVLGPCDHVSAPARQRKAAPNNRPQIQGFLLTLAALASWSSPRYLRLLLRQQRLYHCRRFQLLLRSDDSST